MSEFGIGVAGAVVGGVLGWVGRPVFDRPQRAIQRAFAGDPVAVEVQLLTDRMSDVPPLSGPTRFAFNGADPAYPSPEPSGITGWQEWAYRLDGEDVDKSLVQITLQGLTEDPVSVEAPVIHRHRVMPRRVSTCFGMGGLGGGGVLARNYLFELDGEQITRTFEETAGRPEAFQLSAGETERLIVRVHVEDAMRHEWVLRIPYIRRGRRDHIEVTRTANTPFVTNGYEGLEHWLGGEAGRWVRRRRVFD